MSQRALKCQISLSDFFKSNSLGTEKAGGSSTKEKPSWLNLTLKSGIPAVWTQSVWWIFRCLTWRLTQSHLDDIYQEDSPRSFSWSFKAAALEPTLVWIGASTVWGVGDELLRAHDAGACERHYIQSFDAHILLGWGGGVRTMLPVSILQVT